MHCSCLLVSSLSHTRSPSQVPKLFLFENRDSTKNQWGSRMKRNLKIWLPLSCFVVFGELSRRGCRNYFSVHKIRRSPFTFNKFLLIMEFLFFFQFTHKHHTRKMKLMNKYFKQSISQRYN